MVLTARVPDMGKTAAETLNKEVGDKVKAMGKVMKLVKFFLKQNRDKMMYMLAIFKQNYICLYVVVKFIWT